MTTEPRTRTWAISIHSSPVELPSSRRHKSRNNCLIFLTSSGGQFHLPAESVPYARTTRTDLDLALAQISARKSLASLRDHFETSPMVIAMGCKHPNAS